MVHCLCEIKKLSKFKKGVITVSNRKLSASCVVIKDNKVLLVKHTYGAAKGKYLIPGEFSEEEEMPQETAEREVLEETKVSVKANELIAVRFTLQEVWCIFSADYLSGVPTSDGMENNEAIFMPIDEALRSGDVVDTTKQILSAMLKSDKPMLVKSDFVNSKYNFRTWQIFI